MGLLPVAAAPTECGTMFASSASRRPGEEPSGQWLTSSDGFQSDPLDDDFADGVVPATAVADPDLALPDARCASWNPAADQISRRRRMIRAGTRTPPPSSRPPPAPVPGASGSWRCSGASMALGDHLIAHPEHWRSVAEAHPDGRGGSSAW